MSTVTNDIDDSFYENITIGLLSKLRTTANVSDVQIERRIPCNRLMISAWEHSNNAVLPNDLKEFYSATDGFKLTWKYNYFDNNAFTADITINTLSMLNRLGDLNREYGSWIELLRCEQQMPNRKSDNVFQLNYRQDVGHICLVYFKDIKDNDRVEGDISGEDGINNVSKKNHDRSLVTSGIWLLDKSYQWHELAPSFTVYFRMALVHMGLPLWQFRFTPMGLTPNMERTMTTLMPHIMLRDHPIPSNDVNHQNQLNLLIFKNGHSVTNKSNDNNGSSNNFETRSKTTKHK